MTPKEILEKWIDSFNRADAEAISELYADNATNHQVMNAPLVGKKAIKQMFANEFSTAEMTCIYSPQCLPFRGHCEGNARVRGETLAGNKRINSRIRNIRKRIVSKTKMK